MSCNSSNGLCNTRSRSVCVSLDVHDPVSSTFLSPQPLLSHILIVSGGVHTYQRTRLTYLPVLEFLHFTHSALLVIIVFLKPKQNWNSFISKQWWGVEETLRECVLLTRTESYHGLQSLRLMWGVKSSQARLRKMAKPFSWSLCGYWWCVQKMCTVAFSMKPVNASAEMS